VIQSDLLNALATRMTRRLGIPLPLLSAFSGMWMPLSLEIPCVLSIYGLASILQRTNFNQFFQFFFAMTINSLNFQRQTLNSLGYQGGSPHAVKLKDSVADLKTRTTSDCSVSISPEAQALYERARAVDVTAHQKVMASPHSEPTGGTPAQPELSFDQFVERSIHMACDYYGNEPGEPIHISKFAEKAQRALLDTSTRVQSKLANAGIALDPPIELAPDVAGTGIRVGPHPLREKIQALINEDPGLANDYREAMLMHAHANELQQAERAHLAYYTAYASGRVDEAQRIIEALASAPRVELVQRFAHSGIETRTRSF
jgi:hypothetical protein